MEKARNYCQSAEPILGFSTEDRNGKEMEEGKNKKKILQYLVIHLRIKENKPTLQCDESGKEK